MFVHVAAQMQEPLQTGTSVIAVLTPSFMFPGASALFQLQNCNVLTNDAFNGCRKQERSRVQAAEGQERTTHTTALVTHSH